MLRNNNMRKNFWKDDNLIKEAVALFQKKDYNSALEKIRAADPHGVISIEPVSDDLGACLEFLIARMKEKKFPAADVAQFENVDLENITCQQNQDLFAQAFSFNRNSLLRVVYSEIVKKFNQILTGLPLAAYTRDTTSYHKNIRAACIAIMDEYDIPYKTKERGMDLSEKN